MVDHLPAPAEGWRNAARLGLVGRLRGSLGFAVTTLHPSILPGQRLQAKVLAPSFEARHYVTVAQTNSQAFLPPARRGRV
jgi:hypothetical protein